MAIMVYVDTKKLEVSKGYLWEAFKNVAQAELCAEDMTRELKHDLDMTLAILNISDLHPPNEDTREELRDLMDLPSFKTVSNRVNHLTSPEIFHLLKRSYPNLTEGYMNLKVAIGQLDQAVNPPKGPYDESVPLLHSPVVS
jgi:hypothetical protein